MRLLLDLGNTRLKWVVQEGADWLARGAVAWGQDLADELLPAWRKCTAVERVVGASVVDEARQAQLAALTLSAFGHAPEWLQTPAEACGVRNAYAQPHRLGVDRFLALVAARAAGHGACVLAGVGTALTLDALAADGQHLGGLIAPGPQLMQHALLGATARIRPERQGQVLELADNTADAVASGCWQAAVALIERFASRMSPRLGGAPALLLGGGDAETLLSLLESPAQWVPDAVLQGLAIWADAHPAEQLR